MRRRKDRSPIFEHAAAQWAEMRAEFSLTLEAAYAKAEHETNGNMLSRRGRAEGVDAFSLLIGPYSRVLAFASEELIQHFEAVGRPSLARFEREWIGSRQQDQEQDQEQEQEQEQAHVWGVAS
jgi:hypothetical protein